MSRSSWMLRLTVAIAVPLAATGAWADGGRLAQPRVASAVAAAEAAPAAVTVRPFRLPMPDGTVLRGHVHVPASRAPVATVLTYSPYWNHPAFGEAYRSANLLRQHELRLVGSGFAFAAVNMRGSGLSDGCLQLGGPVDRADVSAVIEALARQPWSNGKVGVFGLSYDGWTSSMAVAARPPALKAAVSASGIIDLWSFVSAMGAPEHFGITFMEEWRTAWAAPPDLREARRPHCADEIAAEAAASAEMVRTGDRTPYFLARDLRPLMRGSSVPVFATVGMRNLGEYWHNRQYDALWSYRDPARDRLLVGQWGHSYPPGGADQDFTSMVVGWFDQYLRDGPVRVSPGVFEYQDDDLEWHAADRWPPRPTQLVPLLLSEQRLVEPGGSVRSSAAPVRSFDADPGRGCAPHRELSHHALYVSPPLAADAVVAGSFQLKATVSSSLPGGNLSGILYKTTGDGSCQDVWNNGVEVGRAQLDLRHWRSPGRSRDFPVLTPTVVDVRGEPFISALNEGERLVLALGGGSAHMAPDPLHPTLTFLTGAGASASITLPVTRGRLEFAPRP